MRRVDSEIEREAAIEDPGEVERVGIRIGRLDDRHACHQGTREDIAIVAGPTGEGVVAGEARERVGPRIPDNRVGECRPDDILEPRRVRDRQRQSGHERLGRRRRQIEIHPSVGEIGEVERIGVGVSCLDDRHARRLCTCEDVGVVPGGAREDRAPCPGIDGERVDAAAGRQIRPLDPGKRIASHSGERRGGEREVDIRRFDNRVDPVAAGEGIVSGATGEGVVAATTSKRVVAGEAGERVVAGVAKNRVSKRRPDDVLNSCRARQRHGQPSHERLGRRHCQIEIHATIEKTGEVERVGVGVGVGVIGLDDGHACRRGA